MNKLVLKEERVNGCKVDTTLAQIIMNQTTYTKEEALEKLGLHNNDICGVLREFMSIPEPLPAKITSINQSIYKEIRHNLGIVDISYNVNDNK